MRPFVAICRGGAPLSLQGEGRGEGARASSALITIALLLLTACSARTSGAIKKQASVDLQCSEGQVHVSAINKRQGQYLAEACQRRAVYSYTKQNGVVRLSEVEGPGATTSGGQPVVVMPPATTDETLQPPPPPPPPPPTP